MNILIPYLLLIFVFIAYVTMIVLKYGILPSISDSYYKLPNKFKFLFTLFCWGFGLPAIIVGVELSDSILMFLAGAGICFVGAAAQFKQTLTKTVHEIGAIAGILFSQLSIAINFKLYLINVLFLLLTGCVYLFKIKNSIWWIEILAFISICSTLAIKIL